MPRVDKCPDCGNTNLLEKCSICGAEVCEEACLYYCDICGKQKLCFNCLKAQGPLFNDSTICADCGKKIAEHFAKREAARTSGLSLIQRVKGAER